MKVLAFTGDDISQIGSSIDGGAGQSGSSNSYQPKPKSANLLNKLKKGMKKQNLF